MVACYVVVSRSYLLPPRTSLHTHTPFVTKSPPLFIQPSSMLSCPSLLAVRQKEMSRLVATRLWCEVWPDNTTCVPWHSLTQNRSAVVSCHMHVLPMWQPPLHAWWRIYFVTSKPIDFADPIKLLTIPCRSMVLRFSSCSFLICAISNLRINDHTRSHTCATTGTKTRTHTERASPAQSASQPASQPGSQPASHPGR